MLQRPCKPFLPLDPKASGVVKRCPYNGIISSSKFHPFHPPPPPPMVQTRSIHVLLLKKGNIFKRKAIFSPYLRGVKQSVVSQSHLFVVWHLWTRFWDSLRASSVTSSIEEALLESLGIHQFWWTCVVFPRPGNSQPTRKTTQTCSK